MVAKLDEILDEQRTYFNSGATLDVDFRIEKLKILKENLPNKVNYFDIRYFIAKYKKRI